MNAVEEGCVTNDIPPFMISSFSMTERLGLMVVLNTYLQHLYLLKMERWNKLVCIITHNMR